MLYHFIFTFSKNAFSPTLLLKACVLFGFLLLRKWCPENCPPVRVRVWFRISVRIRAGRGQFSSGAIFLEPAKVSLVFIGTDGYFEKISAANIRHLHSTQAALISMLEKWKLSIDNKGFAGGILMDLSKAFDTINHPLF